MYEAIPDNPYLLLTPGPLSTTKSVRNAMLRDWCTWDTDYNIGVVQTIRKELTRIAASNPGDYTTVLMQGSGSFGIEACLGTAVPRIGGKLIVVANGAYGRRMAQMMQKMGRAFTLLDFDETTAPEPALLEKTLKADPEITHVAMVHCETTTGILNPIEELTGIAKQYEKRVIIDAMSSFGGIPMDLSALDADFAVSSANKCVQGVPGFSFVLAKKSVLETCAGNAHSLCLDLYDQWQAMDADGKWRYTSPTHVVHAFLQALIELAEEGGVEARYMRYCQNQRILTNGMEMLGFYPLLTAQLQSPIITSFLYPDASFNFPVFYEAAKRRGFVLYPGKISKADTFRIGNIGAVYPEDMQRLLLAIEEITQELAAESSKGEAK